MKTLTQQDKDIIRVLQEDFPLCEEPYKILAQSVGLSEENFLQRVQKLIDEKKIRRISAILRHNQVGFNSNALCAWRVQSENIESIAQIMSSHPAVSHCYDREPSPNWNYNLYTMIHAKNREECEKFIQELAHRTGVIDYEILYTKREWKKTSMRYFCEPQNINE